MLEDGKQMEYKDLDELFMFYQGRHGDKEKLTRSEVQLIENFLFDVFFEDDNPKYKIIKTGAF